MRLLPVHQTLSSSVLRSRLRLKNFFRGSLEGSIHPLEPKHVTKRQLVTGPHGCRSFHKWSTGVVCAQHGAQGPEAGRCRAERHGNSRAQGGSPGSQPREDEGALASSGILVRQLGLHWPDPCFYDTLLQEQVPSRRKPKGTQGRRQRPASASQLSSRPQGARGHWRR